MRDDRIGLGTSLLLLDESVNHDVEPRTESLTGLLLPVAQANVVRQAFYVVLRDFITPKPGVLNLSPPELHFSELLPDQPDEIKLRVVSGIVDLVVEYGLSIFRVSYFMTPELEQLFAGAPVGSFSLNWFGIQTVIQPVLAEGVVIPLFDAGFNKSFQPIVDAVARGVVTCDVMRAAGKAENLSIRNTENLCEVAFADSRHSALVQIVDIVAGLRRVSETARLRSPEALTPFKRRLLEGAKRLEPLVRYDDTIEMSVAT